MSVETTTGEETKIEETKAEPKAKTKAKKSRKEKKAEAATAAEARHTEKCPACGAIRAEGAATCPDCGFEYGGPPPVIESLSVDPATIREGENSRCVAEANYLDTVQARALDIFVNGQIAPCECRRDETGLVLVSGFTRKAAVELIRTGFTAVHPINGGEPQFFCDPSRLLRVQVVNVTPEQAFLRGIKENIERKDTTDLQEAEAQNKLRMDMGWSDTRIARFYNYTNQNRVMALKKLLDLDKATQRLVHEGKLSLSAALITSGMTDGERAAIFAAAGDGDRVRGELVAKLTRDLYDRVAEGSAGVEKIDDKTDTGKKAGKTADKVEGETTGPKPKRNTAAFKALVADFETKPEAFDPAVLDLLRGLVAFFEAKRGFGETKIKNLCIALKAV